MTADSCLLFAVLFHHSGAAKVVAAGLVTVGGGIGGTVLYAKWDPKFRSAVEKNVPYSDKLFGLALGPASQDAGLPIRKQVRIGSQHILTNALRSVGFSSPLEKTVLRIQQGAKEKILLFNRAGK